MASNHDSLRRVFREGFTVRDVACALPSFDGTTHCEQAKASFPTHGPDAVGVRANGIVTGFVLLEELTTGCCAAFVRPFSDELVVPDTLPFAELVLRLNDQQRLFVMALGQVGGVVTRLDVQKPPGRMWLFGMITLIEMRFSSMIERSCPSDSWTEYLSEGRLEKAQQLLFLRRTRNQNLSLSDCLQFADKTSIIARNTQLRSLTRFQSRREVEQIGKQLENLRNSLAHSQDIVVNDWETIVALAEQLDSILDGPPGITSGTPSTGIVRSP